MEDFWLATILIASERRGGDYFEDSLNTSDKYENMIIIMEKKCKLIRDNEKKFFYNLSKISFFSIISKWFC